MDDLLREAIADAKAVRETALENAKIALEEAFTPRLQSMLSKKIQSEIEVEEGEHEDDEDVEEGMHDEDEDDMDEKMRLKADDEDPTDDASEGMHDEDEDDDPAEGRMKDEDEDDVLTLTLRNLLDIFDLDSSTGALTVKNNSQIKYAINTKFDLDVKVSDGIASSESIVTVNIIENKGSREPKV